MSQDRPSSTNKNNQKPQLYSPSSAFKRFKINRKLSFQRYKDNSTARAAVLNKNSAIAKTNMNKLLSSITNTYSQMCTHYNKDEKIHSNMRNIAIGQTKQLKTEVQRINKINSELNNFYSEKYTDTANEEVYPLTMKDYVSKEDDISYDDISIVAYDDEKSKTMNKKVEEMLSKKDTLHKLKGEIILREQRLKYHMNEAYEKPKVLRKRDFIRSDFDAVKYKPKLMYNKNNLVYKKQYVSKEQTQNVSQNKTAHFKSRTNRPISQSSYLSSISNTNTLITSFPITIKSYTSSKPTTSRNINVSSTSTQSTTFNKKNKIRLASPSPSSFNHKSHMKSIDNDTTPNITNETLCTYTYTIPSKHKRFTKRNDVCQKIKVAHLKVYTNGKSITKRIMNSVNNSKNLNKTQPKIKKEKDFDLNAIIKEFKLNLSPRFQPINETKIIASNAERVSKYLTKGERFILRDIVQQLLRENHCVNSHVVKESLNDRQLRKIKQDKEFKKVCNQTMAIKKHFNIKNTIEPLNEKEKIHKLMSKMSSTSWDDSDNLTFLVLKSKVMEHIKPLLINKHNI